MLFVFSNSIGLTYANIGLKNEVQNLSLRINESKLFSGFIQSDCDF
jgi:hypothetical protein